MLEIDFDFDSVLDRNRFGHGLAGQNGGMIFEAFLLAHRAMTSLDDRARMKQVVQPINYSRAHSVRARRQQLHDEHVTESIDDYARKPVAVAVDEAVRVRIVANEAPAQLERALQPARDQFLNRGSLTPRQHPQSDRRRGIAVTHSDQLARRVMHRDQCAGFRRGRIDSLDCLREDPRIAAADRSFPAALEDYAGELRAHRAGHGGSPARTNSPLRPPRFSTSRIAPISIARSIALAMS